MDSKNLRGVTNIHDLAEVQEPGDIERIEQDDGTVRYTNILLLAPGVWGDAGSGRHIYYSPEGIENSADNWEQTTVNLFHERDNEVTDVGDVDTDTVFVGVDDDGLHGDLVLHMDNSASEFADDALQNSLETSGREGLQGPSVELQGDRYRYNEDQGVHELVEGTFNGLGLVGLGVSPGPGSKDAAFAEQVQDRAVALASSDDANVLTLQDNDTMSTEVQIALLAEHGVQLGDDPDEETVQKLADAFELADEDDEDGDGDDNPDDGGDEGEGDDMDDDDEDTDVDIEISDVAEKVDSLGEQVSTNAERIDAIASATEALQEEDVDLTELSESVSTLSDAVESAAGSDRVDDLESRLSEIEDEPEEPVSLADIGDEPTENDGERAVTEFGSRDPTRPIINNGP